MITIDDVHVKDMVEHFKIPPRPQVMIEIQNELNKPREQIDLGRFADIVAKDVAMSAVILKTINSPLFGFNRAISDIKRSVIMLGAKYVSTMAMEFQFKQIFKQKAAISLEQFWEEAAAMASMMLFIHKYMGYKHDCAAEDVYAFGMFRDCGMPIMALNYQSYKKIFAIAELERERLFTDLENEFYAANHATVGYFIARSWHFPQALRELILNHHQTDFLQSDLVKMDQKMIYVISKLAINTINLINHKEEHSEWHQARDSVLSFLELSEVAFDNLQLELISEYQYSTN